MYPLRQRLIECMQARHLAVRTQQTYVRWMVELTRFYHRSPDELSDQELKAFLWSLSLQRHLSTSTCLQAFHALSFFYHEVLAHTFSEQLLPAMKRQQKIPDLLSPRDVAAILRACHQPKYFTVFTVCYGCGTRIGETLQLKVTDIDSELGLIHIRQGKGAKDRLVPLPKRVLAQLRDYWLRARPPTFLFSGHHSDQSLSISSVSKVYQRSKVAAGIVKQGGVHALRHAFATHQLAAGMPITQLQHILGHRQVSTTLRYTHWLPAYQADQEGAYDLIEQLALLP